MKRYDLHLDKTTFSVVSVEEQDEQDRQFWLSKTPSERLAAVELMRQLNYDYDPATARLQRVLEVTQRAKS